MRSYGLILLVQIACLIHAGRTGRPYFWFMIILFVPGLGILAYLVVEVIPGLLRGRAAARLSQTVSAGLGRGRKVAPAHARAKGALAPQPGARHILGP
jgi:hypothetical protein